MAVRNRMTLPRYRPPTVRARKSAAITASTTSGMVVAGRRKVSGPGKGMRPTAIDRNSAKSPWKPCDWSPVYLGPLRAAYLFDGDGKLVGVVPKVEAAEHGKQLLAAIAEAK